MDGVVKIVAKQNQETTGIDFTLCAADTEAVKKVLTYRVLP
jgi:hypothetical protein